ncbi:MAG: 4-demethylwyosine synthase TYW1 [Nanoarchaeota archaeon]
MSQRLPKSTQKDLQKKQYGIHNHSAVQICHWNKMSLRGEGECYKDTFYGVHTHRCMQFSPASMWCDQRCIFCWRPTEYMDEKAYDTHDLDTPEQIVEALIAQREKLLIGFKGNEKVDPDRFYEAVHPDHYAISLSGEPTLYPHLPQMVKYLKERRNARTVFVVTNAQHPSYFQKLLEEPACQPTQLYISLEAYGEESFRRINRPTHPDAWQRLQESLSLFSQLSCRRVIRVTLIKGVNTSREALQALAVLIRKAAPDFVEIKSYMRLGLSRDRLSEEAMLHFDEVEQGERMLLESLGSEYAHEAASEKSLLVLLKRVTSPHETRI